MPEGVFESARFAHEALLYTGEDEFVDATAAFIREGVEAGEPVLVVVGPAKIARLREELNGEGDDVLFTDMADLGSNPALIIPAWQAFVGDHLRADRPVRGIGEPVWAGRTPDELVECQRHESLVNLAFADAPAWRLLCPYDTSTLDDPVIEEALRSHPIVVQSGERVASDRYRGLDEITREVDTPLPAPPLDAVELSFEGEELAATREVVFRRAADAGLSSSRAHDLVLAVNEVLTNSIRYGGGGGVLRMWRDDGRLVCEIEDRGRIHDPLVDRRRPEPDQPNGRGLWIANQLCDLVQLRSPTSGTIVRLHIRST
jgi:anti-sigma regulatory factor (Ser/Thr protein kinase)